MLCKKHGFSFCTVQYSTPCLYAWKIRYMYIANLFELYGSTLHWSSEILLEILSPLQIWRNEKLKVVACMFYLYICIHVCVLIFWAHSNWLFRPLGLPNHHFSVYVFVYVWLCMCLCLVSHNDGKVEAIKFLKKINTTWCEFYCCVMYSGVECVVCCYSECISHTRQAEKSAWPRWESNPRPLVC